LKKVLPSEFARLDTLFFADFTNVRAAESSLTRF
jgi:hypothetical protein